MKDIPPPPPPPLNRIIREGHQPPLPPQHSLAVDQPEPDCESSVFGQILNYLKGSAENLGTTKNLLREVSLSVLTAVAVAVLVQLLSPAASPVSEVIDLVNTSVTRQHEADSLRFEHRRALLQGEIDSLCSIVKNQRIIHGTLDYYIQDYPAADR